MTAIADQVQIVLRLRVCRACGALTHSGSRVAWPDVCQSCRAPFAPALSAPATLPVHTRRTGARTWWTRERVIVGLRRFYKEHGFAPTSTEHWHQLTANRGGRGGGPGTRRPYPSLYAVLRYFDTFRQAWAAAGIEVGRMQESWSELEDCYLREGAGVLSRVELARDLQRTPDAVHRRLYDLGLHTYQRWG